MGEEGREQRFCKDCRYWEGSFQNEAILQSLLQMEDDGPYSPQSLRQSSGVANNEQKKGKSPTQEYLSFFWDESASNQATIELLMKNEELEKQSMSVWEEKEIVFAHQANSSRSRTETEPVEQAPVQYFPWEDPDTVAGLLEVENLSRRASNDSPFLWDDPAAIGMLLTDEEDEALLAREDKTDMTEELLPECMTWDARGPGRKRRESIPPGNSGVCGTSSAALGRSFRLLRRLPREG